MKIQRMILYIILLALPLLLCSCTVGIEKPKYTVLEKEGNFEVRQYPSYLIAETIVDADFEDAGNIAFRRLFKYISGDNKKKESISMTAPVNQTALEGRYAVSFVMPSKYTMDTIPEPMDKAVVIKQVSAQTMAAVRYSGTWSRKRYEEKNAALEEFIKRKELAVLGEPIFARYNPPFELWFLRRNEVLIPVE